MTNRGMFDVAHEERDVSVGNNAFDAGERKVLDGERADVAQRHQAGGRARRDNEFRSEIETDRQLVTTGCWRRGHRRGGYTLNDYVGAGEVADDRRFNQVKTGGNEQRAAAGVGYRVECL